MSAYHGQWTRAKNCSSGKVSPMGRPSEVRWALTVLTTSVSQVLCETQHKNFLRWSSQMKTDPTKRDSTKYCEFHRDHGHRKDDCIQLRKEIEYLIRRDIFVASWPQRVGARHCPHHLVSQLQLNTSNPWEKSG